MAVVRNAAATTVEIGFLEDQPAFIETRREFFESPVCEYVVRVVFQCSDGKWTAFPYKSHHLNELCEIYSTQRNWRAFMAGVPIGTVLSDGFAKYNRWFSVGSQRATKASITLSLDSLERSMDYACWAPDRPQRRPIVLVANTDSPDLKAEQSWGFQKGGTLPASVVEKFNEGSNEHDFAELPTRDVAPDFLRCWGRVTENGEPRLWAVAIDEEAGVVDNTSDPDTSTYWFIADENGVRFLRKGLSFIDAGDFNKDGMDELLFWVYDYNRNGYLLLEGNMSYRVAYLWGYH